MRKLLLISMLTVLGCQATAPTLESDPVLPTPLSGVVVRDGVTKANIVRVTEEEALLSALVSIDMSQGSLKTAMLLIVPQLIPSPTVSFSGEGSDQEVRLFHQGPLKGALRQLEAQTGLAVSIEQGTIIWRDQITREFEIAVLPGRRSFNIGNKTQSGDTSDSQFMSARGDEDTWTGLAKSLQAIMGKAGTVIASPMVSTITVTGTPNRVRRVATLVDDLNERLTRQVHLDIKVIQVTLDSKEAMGIDWGAVRTTTSSTLSLAGQSAVFNPTSSGDVFRFAFGKKSGSHAGSQVLIEALQTQGRVKVISEPQVLALNYQTVEQRWVTETSYLASTTASSGSDNLGQSGMNPSKVIDGMTLFIQPNIGRNHIILHTSLTIAALVDMPSIESGGQTIQTPITSKSVFNEITLAKGGETLIISGLRHVTHKGSQSQPYGMPWLKGSRDEREIVETVLLVTPRLVH